MVMSRDTLTGTVIEMKVYMCVLKSVNFSRKKKLHTFQRKEKILWTKIKRKDRRHITFWFA